MASPATCIVYTYLQDILGNNVGLASNAKFSAYGGKYKYGTMFIDESSVSSSFDSNGYAQLVVNETQTPGVYLNFSISYQIGESVKQITFRPAMVPNIGAVSLANIAQIGSP